MTGDERREHLLVDAALAEGKTALVLPPVARNLIGDFARSLANRGLLHPLEAETVCRVLGARDV